MAQTSTAAKTTLVFAANLVGSKHRHRGVGSFAGVATDASLRRELLTFLRMSPGLCREGVEVHIVHDLSLIHI